jgi:RNA polymerase sigma-70 factor (ECF subfamily)
VFGVEEITSVNVKPSFEQIVLDYGPMIKRIASSYEADTQLAEELVQDTLFAIWSALPSFRGDASMRTFVAKIATNRAVTHIRRTLRRARTIELSLDVPASGAGPEDQVIALDEHTRLLAAVRSLPLAYRQAALLALEGLACAEVASVLGISVNAVAVRMSRAKDLLRERMGGQR